MAEEPKQGGIPFHQKALRLDLIVDEEMMNATLRIQGIGGPVDQATIAELLNERGIVYGLDAPAIARLISRYATGESATEPIEAIIARGKPGVPGQDGSLDILIRESEHVIIDETGRADFRNVERYRTVEKGQAIARITQGIPGKPGINLLGEEVEPDPIYQPVLNAGQNVDFRASSNEYVARVKGIFIYKNDTVEVSPILIIPGNVGLESGNVHYDGSAQVEQNVERGSSVQVHGDLTVGGAVETGDVRVGGSLIVKKGINTRKDGIIRVSGQLNAVYIDNTKIHVEGQVSVEKSIISSTLITHSSVYLPAKGSTISGGEIMAFGDVEADIIGNKMEVPTRIIVGEHYKNKMYYELHSRELEDLNHEYEKVATDVQKIKTYVTRMRGNIPVQKKAEFRVIFQKYKEITERRAKLEELVHHFKESRFNKAPVRIIARDIIYPGVELHYRNVVEKIKAPITACILTFKTGREKFEMEAYKEP